MGILDVLYSVFYQPLFNLLVFLYNTIPGSDIGVTIIALTVIIKLILYPFSIKSLRSQRALQELQPKVDELKIKFKDQKEDLAKELMKLYQAEKVSPFSSCLPLLIQIPFLFALYHVFQTGLSSASITGLYPFVANPGNLNPIAFGLVNLAQPHLFLAVLAGISQFFQAKMLMARKPAVTSEGSKDENMMTIMNRQMLYMMPVMTVIIGATLPGGLTLYWLISTVITIAQQWLTFHFHPPRTTDSIAPVAQ